MPDKLPVLKAKEVVRALERAGFYIHRQTGSNDVYDQVCYSDG